LKRKIIALFFNSILFQLLFFSLSFSQALSELEFSKLDKIILNEDLVSFNNFFKNKYSDISNFNLDETYLQSLNQVEKQYRIILASFSRINAYSEEEINKLIEQYASFSSSFSKIKAGDGAHSLYQEFLSKSKQGEKFLALKYYYLAYNRKYWYMENEKEVVKDKIFSIEEAIKNKDYDSALILLNDLNIRKQPLSLDNHILARIEQLDEIVDSYFKEKEIRIRERRNIKNMNRGFNLGIGVVTTVFSPSIDKNQTWYFDYNQLDRTLAYEIDKISFIRGYMLSVYLSRYLFNAFNLHVSYEYGEAKIETKNELTNFASTFNLKSYQVAMLLNHYLKKTAGVRPYWGFGISYFSTNTEPYTWAISPFAEISMNLRQVDSSIPQCLGTFGIEYIHPDLSNVSFQTYYLLSYNLKYSNLVGAYEMKLGFRFNYRF